MRAMKRIPIMAVYKKILDKMMIKLPVQWTGRS